MHSFIILVFSLLSIVLIANVFVGWLPTAYSALPNVHLSAVGDWGCNSNTGRTVDNINSKNPDGVLALGDYSYQSTATCWFNAISSIDSKTKINIGNHDDETSSLLGSFMNHFGLSSQFYAFDYPASQPYIHVLTMSTEQSTSSGSAQFNFVKNDLQMASQNPNIKWIIVNMHKPIYSSPNTCSSSSCAGSSSVRDTYVPLFDQYKVDIVLEGHTHDYQRTFPLKYNPNSKSNPIKTSTDLSNYNNPGGRIFAIVGTGGINFHGLSGKASFTASQQDNSFGILDLNFVNDGSKLEGKFYANLPDGGVKDQFSITKSFTNTPPTANAQSVTVNKDTSKPITLTGSDPDGNTLTFTKLTDPAHGTTSGTAPFLTYTPSSGYVGPDSFTFKTNDGTSDSNIATISINVVESTGGYHYDPSLSVTGSNFQDVPSESKYQIPRFTLASWFKTSANYGTGSGMIINKGGFGSDSSGLNMNFGLWIFSNKLSGGFEASSGADVFATSSATFNDGQWHYGVVTYDGSAVRVYADGIQVASTSATSNPETSGTLPVRIGANSQSANSFFNGNIDEVRIWNKALTSQQLVEAFNGNFNTQGSAVLYLDFSGSSAASTLRASSALSPAAAPKVPVALDQQVNVTKDNPTPIMLTSSNTNVSAGLLKYSTLSQPSHGVIAGKAPSLFYIPASGYTGSDSFTFKVNDGRTDSNIGTVGLTVKDYPQASINQPSQQSTVIDSADKDENKTSEVPKQPKQQEQVVQPSLEPKENKAEDDDTTTDGSSTEQQKQGQQNATQSGPSDSIAVPLGTQPEDKSGSSPSGKIQKELKRNQIPRADAGINQQVEEGKLVTLDGSKSRDRDGKAVSYVWKQILGPKIQIEPSNESTASFVAPTVVKDENLIFTLTVTDDNGASDSDSVRIKILNLADSLPNNIATG